MLTPINTTKGTSVKISLIPCRGFSPFSMSTTCYVNTKVECSPWKYIYMESSNIVSKGTTTFFILIMSLSTIIAGWVTPQGETDFSSHCPSFSSPISVEQLPLR